MNVLTDDIISVIATRDFLMIKRIFWYKWMMILHIDHGGRYLRLHGPALIYDNDIWWWYFHGKKHRLDQTKPVSFKFGYYDWYNMDKFVAKRKNKIEFFLYLQMNVLTQDLISVIVTRDFSIIKHMFYWRYMEIWYVNRNMSFHRINGPALIWDNNDWEWYFNDNCHRLDQTKPSVKIDGHYYSWYNMDKHVAECKK